VKRTLETGKTQRERMLAVLLGKRHILSFLLGLDLLVIGKA